MNDSVIIPAGYIEISGTWLHVAKVRQHTTDVHRFMAYMPAALELMKHAPGSALWIGVLESVTDADKLQATVTELGQIYLVLADELEREKLARVNEQ